MIEWIDLNKKFPDSYSRVLCHRPDRFTVVGKAIVGTKFCQFYSDDGFELINVTHWMPLPEKPKD